MRITDILTESSDVCPHCGKNPCECEHMDEGFDPASQDYSDWLDITRKETMRSGKTDGANSLEIMAQHGGDDITDVIRNILAYVKQNSQELSREVSDETGKTVKDAIIDIKNNFPQQYQAASQPQGVAEGENWSKYNHKRVGGMSKKSVASYRRSHPGSKIQTAVTTKPSKLKKGSKSAKRRASFCARMRGMKKHRTSAKTARDPNSNINKSLRRWHCESIEQMEQLIMLAEQFIAKNKKL